MSAPVHFKVQLIHAGVKPAGANSDFHRFSGAYTFEEFQATVGLLWGDAVPAAGFVVHYTDEDGDKVLLKDKQDWEECMRVYRDAKLATLRVTVTANTPKQQPAPQSQPQAQSQQRERTPPPSCGSWGGAGRSRPNGRRCGGLRDFFQNLPAFSQAGCGEPMPKCCDPHGPQPQTQQHADPNASEEERMWSAWGSRLSQALQNAGDFFIRPMNFMPSPGFEFRTPDQKAVVDLLSSLFGSEAVSNLATGATDAFGSTVRFCRNLGEDLHIDVNMAALYNQSIRAANAAMDAKNYAAAERLLRDALAVFKNNNVLEYNLSCAQSLKGNLHGAFETLQQAIGHGYDNFTHLVSDPDLANLRAFPGFTALLNGRPGQRTAGDAVETPKDAGNATSDAPIPTATAEPPSATAEKSQEEPPTATPAATTGKESPQKDSQFDLCDNDAAPPAPPLPTLPVTAPTATAKPAPADDVPPPLEEPRAAAVQPTANAQGEGLPVPQPIRTILSIFPGMSVADAALALLQAGGNVNVAINNLLASG